MLTTIGGLTPTKNMFAESIGRTFNRVVECMMRLQGQLLKKSEPIPEDSTNRRWKWFKNCLGALDGTHIKMKVPVKDKPHYRNRKGEISTNVLGVCSQDEQFIYVLAGWEGSAADGRILKDAIMRPNGQKERETTGDTTRVFQYATLKRTQCHRTLFWHVKDAMGNSEESLVLPVVEAIPDGVGVGDGDVSSIPMDVEPISTVEPSTEWTNWRDSLANEMFNDFRSRMSQQTQGSASSKRPMRMWSHEEDKALMDSMLELHLGSTFNADNGLKVGSLRDLEAKMEAKLLGCFGWDPHTCMVLAERDVWDNYLRSHKKCAPYRSKPFPLFESLTNLFGKDRATGKESRSTNDVLGEMPHDDDVYIPQLNEEVDMSLDDISTQAPESSSAKRQKREKAKEGAEEGFNGVVDKICASMNNGLEQATEELCVHLLKNEIELGEKLDKLYDELLLINGISYNKVFLAHIHLSSNLHQMLSYFSLSDNAKLFWVRALLDKK
ncbi:protein ALP1-like [Senna tora]|uniref:Protein ALP1-like n=1 Tax=Senna tora TaxID=362788 RepID=A0A834WRK3_9FABA|nr:protein ALP1-like [Senna tora]